MANKDSDPYKRYLREYLERKGVEYNPKTKKWRCQNTAHADNEPSATLYHDGEERANLTCHVCGMTWDIFDVAGMQEGLTAFPDKIEAVKRTIGDLDFKPKQNASPPKEKKKDVPPPALVPLEREKAKEIFNPTALVDTIKKFKLLTGDVHFVKVWPYYNADGLIEIFDVRFENENGKKAVITFFWDGSVMRMKGAPILLYNRHKLKADSVTPVLIVEGAKSAEAAEHIPGFIPVTWNGGGKKYKMVDWSPLQGREVFILPDDDQKLYGEKHPQAGELIPAENQPGIDTAIGIQKKIPHAKIIPPPLEARKVKADGADIVEILQVMKPAEVAEYILKTPPMQFGKTPPPSSLIDTPRYDIPDTPEGFPFRILGVADDGKSYFLDRHERLTSFSLGGITQNKLLTLASLTFWQGEFATGKGGVMMRDDWTAAIDAVIQVAGVIDFDPDKIRGRGAWRERDGRICYHDGLHTRGEASSERLYLRMTRKDIGLDSPAPKLNDLKAVLEVTGQLSFETRADMIRCVAWSTLAPFAGALPWRPAGLLTGRSESGKSTIVDMIVKPLSMPFIFSGGETTEAGIRQTIKNDAVAIVIEEAETDTPKKRQRREDVLSLMRQSTSDETPKAAKGTIDGKGMHFTLRSMFMFVAISPEVESIADDNRLFRVNLEKNENDWPALKKRLGELLVPELCAKVRALTWSRLDEIFEMAHIMSPVIQKVTNKSARFALAESMLFAAYQVIWKQNNLTENEMYEFFEKVYEMQPVEESRDETSELLDRLLDESIQDGKDRYTIRRVLQNIVKGIGDSTYFKDVAGRYGLGITPDGHLAIAKNFYAISRIIERGQGYQRIFFRHPLLVDRGKSVSLGGKIRNCVIIDGQILTESGEEVF